MIKRQTSNKDPGGKRLSINLDMMKSLGNTKTSKMYHSPKSRLDPAALASVKVSRR